MKTKNKELSFFFLVCTLERILNYTLQINKEKVSSFSSFFLAQKPQTTKKEKRRKKKSKSIRYMYECDAVDKTNRPLCVLDSILVEHAVFSFSLSLSFSFFLLLFLSRLAIYYLFWGLIFHVSYLQLIYLEALDVYGCCCTIFCPKRTK